MKETFGVTRLLRINECTKCTWLATCSFIEIILFIGRVSTGIVPVSHSLRYSSKWLRTEKAKFLGLISWNRSYEVLRERQRKAPRFAVRYLYASPPLHHLYFLIVHIRELPFMDLIKICEREGESVGITIFTTIARIMETLVARQHVRFFSSIISILDHWFYSIQSPHTILDNVPVRQFLLTKLNAARPSSRSAQFTKARALVPDQHYQEWSSKYY